MVAVDTNVLVYAHRREVREHEKAAQIVRALAEGTSRWAIPWPCLYEFLSVVTNTRIWKQAASSPAQAWAQAEVWLASPTVRCLAEPEDFADILSRFARRPRIRGPLIHDARVAALCVAHGVETLLTRDRDFSLFPELETRDPF